MIKKISDNTTSSFFPDHFTNEIYYSNIQEEMQPFSYTSSLSLKFNKSGYDYYKIGNREHRLRSNQYLIVNSGTELCAYTDTASEGMSIFIDKCHLNEVAQAWQNPESILNLEDNTSIDFTQIPFSCDNYLGRFIGNFFEFLLINQFNKYELPSQFYYKLAETMIKQQLEIDRSINKIPRIKKAVKEEIYRRLMIGKEFIDDHICDNISLNQISRIAGISSYYLIKCFNDIFGITPYQYILQKRIEVAKVYLKNENKSIQEISIDCGFSDIYSFSKYFKKVCQLSPSDYRKTA